MANEQTPGILVARFLKANHYYKTLELFLRETNLPDKSATTQPGDWTLEKLIQEKITFDTSLNFERHSDEGTNKWTQPAPSTPQSPDFAVNTNVLCIAGHSSQNLLSVSTADNTCTLLQGKPPYSPIPDRGFKNDSPILSTLFTNDGQMASTAMSGKLLMHDLNTSTALAEVRHHSKWAVNSTSYFDSATGIQILATAGWDKKVNIYALHLQTDSRSEPYALPDPAHTLTLPTNPESLFFVTNPDNHQLNLVLSRRDSTFLHYFTIDTTNQLEHADSNSTAMVVTPAGNQNLAPHANAWVTFTPSCLARSPRDPTLLAIATSHLPHLKVLIVRLLFPIAPTPYHLQDANTTAASAARASLALQDIEDKAIMIQASTMAPQTPYSTPQVVWRPDGSGVWVNGDDGVVRGVEAATGKVVSLLRAHEAGSKVRTLWAGYLGAGEEKREVVVSGGFDRRVFVWEIPKESDVGS